MAKGTLQIAYENLSLENLELKERIGELELENKKLRSIKCPPISDGDSCICPIEELETTIKNACDLINNEGKVNKWNILNILNPTLKGL